MSDRTSASLWGVGQLLVGGEAAGTLVRLAEPLSFWGGVDEEDGRIIDGHHSQFGTVLAGTALLMGATRGSSSSSSTLLECIRRGTAPALLLLTEPDPILVVAAVVAWEIYQRGPSVLLVSGVPDTARVTSVRVTVDGQIHADDEEGVTP